MNNLAEKARDYAHQLRRELEDIGGTADIEIPYSKQHSLDIDKVIEMLRWRYVNEELPEEPYDVLVRSSKGNNAIATYSNLTNWVLNPNRKGFGSIIKWRPINL